MNIQLALNVCRVCMKSEECISLLNDSRLLDKFTFTTQLKVEQDDIIPDKICDKCVTRMKVAYDFRRLALESEDNLRIFINKVTSEFSAVTKNNTNSTLTDLTDDEMQILIEEGYRIDDNEALNSSSKSDDSSQVVITKEEEELDEDIEEYHEIIQNDDDSSQMFLDENSEDIQIYEEPTEIIYHHEIEDIQNTGDEVSVYMDDRSEYEAVDESVVDVADNSVESVDLVETKTVVKSKRSSKGDRLKKFESKSFICIKCNKDFSSKTNLMRHMISHDGVKPFQCTICGNGFTQNGSLKQHMLIHKGLRPHVCYVCGRGFTQSKSLTFHMRRHTGEKPFECDQCGLLFRQRDGLKRHVAVKHSNVPAENFVCTVCNRTLYSKHSLQVHMKKHFNRRDNLKCDKCDEVCSSQNALDKHYRTHGPRPYNCNVCDKTFIRRGSLESHLKTHNNEEKTTKNDLEKLPAAVILNNIEKTAIQTPKQLQCGKCYKSFSIKRNLLQHLRNHNLTKSTLVTCDECEIGFNSKRELKLHRQSEHKEIISDLNECEHCNTHFVSVNDLNEHVATTHDLIDEDCSLCQEHFTSSKALDDHLLEHELISVG